MADRKISDLTALTTPASGDYLPIVDISEPGSADKNKRITIEELFRGVPLGTAAAPSIAIEGDENTGIYSPGADQVAISTNGNGRLFIASDGKVGIGTSSPQAIISTRASSGLSTTWNTFTGDGIHFDATNATVSVDQYGPGISWSRNGAGTTRAAAIASVQEGGDSDLVGLAFFTHGSTDNTQPIVERVRIDDQGRVGIGTTSPYQELTLRGTNEQLLFDLNTTTNGQYASIAWNGSTSDNGTGNYSAEIRGYREASGAYGALAFHTRGSSGTSVERLRIDSSGNVGVGTSSPQALLHLSGLNSGAGSANTIRVTDTDTAVVTDQICGRIEFETADTGNPGVNCQIDALYSGSGGGSKLQFRTGFAGALVDALHISDTGAVGIGTGSPDQLLHLNSSSTPTIRFERNDTTVANGEELGAIEFESIDTSSGSAGVLGKIDCAADGSLDGTPTNGGALRFFTSTINPISLTQRMVIDPSGNVGVGTTSPAAKLHVGAITALSGNLSPTAAIVSDTSASGNAETTLGIYQNASSVGSAVGLVAGVTGGTAPYFAIKTRPTAGGNSLERLRIDSSGNVGIGTTNPADTFQINKNATSAASGGLTLKTADSNESFLSIGVSTSLDTAFISSLQNGTGTVRPISFVVGSSSTNERMRIDTSGRLLVGTTSAFGSGKHQTATTAADAIDIGSFSTSAGDGGRLTFYRSKNATAGSATAVADGDSLGRIDFRGYGVTSYSLGARIDAFVDGEPSTSGDTTDMPGRLVFSTTADGASSPTERMRISAVGQVNTYSTDSSCVLRNSNSAGTTYAFLAGIYSATSTTTGGTVSFRVYTNGDVQNTNNSYGAISDIKLKENIVDAGSQWDDLKALQVRKYNFKEGQTHTQIGLIAQEVELVSPGLVTESPDRDEDGNDLGTVIKSVNYSVLYMKAVKALQEAMERIETLEAKVAALESA